MQNSAESAPASLAVTPAATVVARRYHFGWPAVLFLLVTALLIIGAINGQNNLLFWAFGLAVGSLLVSGLISGIALMSIELRVEVLRPAAAGSPMRIRYSIRNRNRFMPAFGLLISEKAGESDDSWSRFMPTPMAFIAHAAAKSDSHAFATVIPTRRGRATFDSVVVSSTFPLGLIRKSVTFSVPRTVLIRPWTPVFESDVLRTLGSAGDNLDPNVSARAQRGEFFALREYRDGDEARSVAWKQSARRDTLLVREERAGRAPRVWMVLGRGDTVEEQERLISLCGGACRLAVQRGRTVAVMDHAGRVLVHPGRGVPQFERTLDALAAHPTSQPGPLQRTVGSADSVLLIGAGVAPRVAAGARVVRLGTDSVPRAIWAVMPGGGEVA